MYNNSSGMNNIYLKPQYECILDHQKYIKLYLDLCKKNIKNNYETGVLHYNNIKNIMRDITFQYPRIASFLLNNDQNISSQSETNLRKEVTAIVPINSSVHNQHGGNREESIKTIERIKTMFNTLRSVDVDKMKILTDTLMAEIMDIDKKLAELLTDEKQLMDTDLVMNNLKTIIQNVKSYDQSTKSYNKIVHGMDLYVPSKSFTESNPGVHDALNLNNILSQILINYISSMGMDENYKLITESLFIYKN
jgi:urease gamma subunit